MQVRCVCRMPIQVANIGVHLRMLHVQHLRERVVVGVCLSQRWLFTQAQPRICNIVIHFAFEADNLQPVVQVRLHNLPGLQAAH